MQLIVRLELALSCLVLLFSLGSCADAMEHDSSNLSQSIEEARQEVDRHHAAVDALRSLNEVPGEMQRHGTNIQDVMDRMHGSMGQMSHCSASSTDHMRQMLDDTETEMGMHSSAVADADTLVDMRSACARHVEAMNATLEAMRDATNQHSCMDGL